MLEVVADTAGNAATPAGAVAGRFVATCDDGPAAGDAAWGGCSFALFAADLLAASLAAAAFSAAALAAATFLAAVAAADNEDDFDVFRVDPEEEDVPVVE